MKNHIIFSLLGGLILFIWQFVSWAAVNFHQDEQNYTPLETEVLTAIAKTGLEPGMYALGQGNPENGEEAKWDDWEANFKGKPWGVLNYQAKSEMVMGMNLLRNFIVSILVSAILFYILLQIKDLTLKNSILISLSIGLIAFCVEPYSLFIWFKTPGIYAHLIDAVVPWVILGALGKRFAR